MKDKKLSESIDKLLRSNNLDDIKLGIELAKEIMGTQWCKENFTFDNEAFNRDGRSENDPYPTPHQAYHELLIFDDINILIGPICIQTIEKDLK